LESLGPILWDFTKRTMAFVCIGHHVLWTTVDTPLLPSLLSVEGNPLEELLLHFDTLFTEPMGLPLLWDHCHHIYLLPGTPPVVVRPYHYAHTHELER
jgi:hypothetical protein